MKLNRLPLVACLLVPCGCGDHRVGYVANVWPITAYKLGEIDLEASDLGAWSRMDIDTTANYCYKAAEGGGSGKCSDEPFADDVAVVRVVNEFPPDAADPAVGSLTLTSFNLELASEDSAAPQLPPVSSTIREVIAAGTARNIILPLVDLGTKRAFARDSNRPYRYVAGYRLRVDGREALSASTSIELAFLSACPEETVAVTSCN